MTVYEALMARRTVRKFKQTPIEREKLVKLIDVARMAPTGANKQPVYYAIVTDKEMVGKISDNVKWAAYLNGTYTPTEDERPSAYIGIYVDKADENSSELSIGTCVENMLIMAEDLGLGSCWMGAIDREAIEKIIDLDENLKLRYVIALGYPGETPTTCDFDGDIKYFLDGETLTVPKKTFEQVVVFDK